MKFITFSLILLCFSLSAAAASTITDELLPSYFKIRESLAGDSIKGVTDAAKELSQLSQSYLKEKARDESVVKDAESIRTCSEKIARAGLEDARVLFKDLSKALIRLHGQLPGNTAVVTYYCSMAPGSWMQATDDIGNPYYGSKMLRCGKKIESRPINNDGK